VDVFELASQPTVVCACGIPFDFLHDLAKSVGLSADDYVFWRSRSLTFNLDGKTRIIQSSNLCTFDKLRFMTDLVKASDATFKWRTRFQPEDATGYDLVVDATGTRQVLGKLPADRHYMAYQVKAKFKEPPDFYFQLMKTPAYMWLFPLTEKTAYVGYASENPSGARQAVETCLNQHQATALQKQAKVLRLNPPYQSQPNTKGNIIGTGNSIGAITSFGEGNDPSAQTARLLAENIHDPQEYQKQTLRQLNWINHDHKAHQAWMQNKRLKLLYHTLRIRKVYWQRYKPRVDYH
jgi:flavin-dependent dehydrogenase